MSGRILTYMVNQLNTVSDGQANGVCVEWRQDYGLPIMATYYDPFVDTNPAFTRWAYPVSAQLRDAGF